MSITIHNYEAYLLDYFEGNLPAAQEQELMRFIEAHPELDVDLNNSLPGSIAELDVEIPASDFSDLKRSDFELPPHIEMELAAYLEGDREDLPQFEDQAQLERALSLMKQCKLEASAAVFPQKNELMFPGDVDMTNTDHQLIAVLEGDVTTGTIDPSGEKYAASWALLQKTRLQPEVIVFPNKEKLYKTAVIPMPWVRVAQLAVAAMLIGVVGALTFYFIAPDASDRLASHALRPNVERSAYELVIDTPEEETEIVSHAVYHPVSTHTAGSEFADRVERIMPLPNRTVQGIGREKEQAAIALSSRGSANPENNDVAMHTNPVNEAEFVPIKTLLETKVKAGLYGSEQYPEDAYVKALMNKASQKATARLNSMKGVHVDVQNDEGARKIDLRIGKFSLRKN